MATFQKFDGFVEAICEKVHNLGADTLKVMLTNTLPISANSVKADITEISAGNGYVAGGLQATQASSSQLSGIYKLTCNDIIFTASGGSIGPFRYIVLYNDTAANKELIGFYDYGSSLTLNDGETFTLDFDATNGVLALQ